jgi:hypothetical protein
MRIMEKHPEWNVVVLVRTEEHKKIVLGRWPSIEVVIGDLDDKELLIKEGSKADVVLRMYLNSTDLKIFPHTGRFNANSTGTETASSDHVPGVQALIEGLSQKKPTPGYFIHVSGTGMMNDVSNGFGACIIHFVFTNRC